MQKLLVVLMCTVFGLGLFGCSGSSPQNTNQPPANMSQTAYDAGRKAVDICEKYLSGNSDADKSADELNAIYLKLGNLSDRQSSDDSVKASVFILYSDLSLGSPNYKVQDDIDALKKKLGI